MYLFGDSITEESFDVGGWGASLANYFSRTVTSILALFCFKIPHYMFVFINSGQSLLTYLLS